MSIRETILKRLSWSVKEFGVAETARQLDWHQSTLSRLLSGERLLNGDQIEDALQYFELKVKS